MTPCHTLSSHENWLGKSDFIAFYFSSRFNVSSCVVQGRRDLSAEISDFFAFAFGFNFDSLFSGWMLR
jgi:hypothetical protein